MEYNRRLPYAQRETVWLPCAPDKRTMAGKSASMPATKDAGIFQKVRLPLLKLLFSYSNPLFNMFAIIALLFFGNNGLSFFLRKFLKMLRNIKIALANFGIRYHNDMEKLRM